MTSSQISEDFDQGKYPFNLYLGTNKQETQLWETWFHVFPIVKGDT
jgi:hypothetical protein